jgi:hypothetical protein
MLKKSYHALCILCLPTSYHAAGLQENQLLASQRGISNGEETNSRQQTNFTPVTNNTKDLMNSKKKAGNLRRGVFWLEVDYTVLSIHNLAASSHGLHFFELHSPMKSPLNSISSSSIRKSKTKFNLFDSQSYHTLDTIDFFRERQENSPCSQFRIVVVSLCIKHLK